MRSVAAKKKPRRNAQAQRAGGRAVALEKVKGKLKVGELR
jgi:hypothetical protein